MQNGVDISAQLKREFKRRSQWGGYVDIHPSIGPNDQRQHRWQFRMSIRPTQANLEKAVNALSAVELLCQTANRPIFKIISPKVLGNGRLDLNGHWDATRAFMESKESKASLASMDRDQRGKEICVYMEFDSHKQDYQFTRAHYKKIMLDLWKAMQDAGVEYGYVHPPQDEIAVNGDRANLPVTPFFYSANKPYMSNTVQEYKQLFHELVRGETLERKQLLPTARHGVMQHTKANPQKFKDNPLSGLRISFRDLRRAGIKYPVATKVLSERIVYHAAHNEVVGDEFAKDFQNLVAKDYSEIGKEVTTSWSRLKSQLKLLEKKLRNTFSKSFLALVEDADAFRCFPSCADTSGTNLLVLYRPLLRWAFKSGDQGAQVKVLKHLEKAFNHERQMLLDEFQAKNVVAFFVEQGICKSIEDILVPIDFSIIERPIELLALYRRLTHLLHEKATLKRAKLQLLRSEYSTNFSMIVGALSGSALLVLLYFSLVKSENLAHGVFGYISEELGWENSGVAIFIGLVTTSLLGYSVAHYEKAFVLPKLPEDKAIACVSKSSRAIRVIGAELGMVAGLVIGGFIPSDYTEAVQIGVSVLCSMLGYKLGTALSTSSVSCCCLFSSKSNDSVDMDSLSGQRSLQAGLLEREGVPLSGRFVSIV